VIAPIRGRSVRAAVLLVAALSALALAAAPTARADFGFLPGAAGFDLTATEADGSVDAEAGTHPYELTTTAAFRAGSEPSGQPGEFFSDGDLRSLVIERPAGLLENPTVVGKCSLAAFGTPRSSPFQASLSGEDCPDASQVGTIELESVFGGAHTVRTFGLFSLAPPPGFPSLLGAAPFGVPIVFAPRIRSAEGEFGLTLEATDVSQQLNVSRLKLSLWGNPWLVGHDRERGDCLNEADPTSYFGTDAVLEREPQTKPPTPPFYEPGTCSVGDPKVYPPLAYLTLPMSCRGPMVSTVTATSWQQPAPVVRVSESHDGSGQPLPLRGCVAQNVEIEGSAVAPTSDRSGSATGLDFKLTKDQTSLLDNVTPTGRLEPMVRASSQVKRAVVTLPEGMTINPSLGAGLGACTPAQYAAETATAPPGAGCPNNSKIGAMTVDSPLFEAPIEGGMFLAQPDDPGAPGAENPFDALLALYLIAKDRDRGVIVKLAGQVQLDPASGRVVASFDNLPQLPYSKLAIRFRDGQRSPLASPQACGSYESRVALNPWLDPGLVNQTRSVFEFSKGIGGGPCPAALAPFAPRSQSGTFNRNAGSYTPFYLHFTRTDADQEITSYSAELPTGLLGKLAGVPFCPEGAIARAAANPGFAETAAPSCPDASRIGRTVSGYGLGEVLAYAPGGLYLAGPYHGSPLSIVAVNAATVGPFDLGSIIVRSAIRVDPNTARVWIDSAGSDPIPHILKGIPIHLRDVRVYIDRPGFTLNPTSCAPSALRSTLSGSGALFSNPGDDSAASVSNHFQVSFCSSLDFGPRLDLRLRGGTRRGSFPALQAVVQARPGDANIGQAAVTLPPSIFLAQEHVRTICDRRQYAAKSCPAASVYGRARAFTPLLEEPMEGPVYLRASDSKLPDLVASLSGRGIDVDVVGRIDAVKGKLRATYDVLPDAPVTKFVMNLDGGKRGLLVNSDDVCRALPAKARMIGHNNRGVVLRPRLLNPRCRKQAKAKKRAQAKRRAQHREKGARR
jgi:hypothetical protein